MRNNIKYLLLIISVVLFSILFIAAGYINHKGAESKEALVKTYLTALTNNDPQTILELTTSTHESRPDVQQLMKKYGGHRFKDIKITYRNSELGGVWYVFISGITLDKNGKSSPYKEQLSIRVGQDDPYTIGYDPLDKKSVAENRKPDRWFLLVGKEKRPFSLFPLPSLGPPLKISP